MANDHDDFAEWRGNIESRVTTLERTVETEASVRAAMDKDMGDLKIEFRAQRSLLQALADTQGEHTKTLRDHGTMLREHTKTLSDHGAMLRDHGTMLRDHGERLTRLEAGVADLQTGLATVGAGVQTIIGLLDREIEGESGAGRNPASPE